MMDAIGRLDANFIASKSTTITSATATALPTATTVHSKATITAAHCPSINISLATYNCRCQCNSRRRRRRRRHWRCFPIIIDFLFVRGYQPNPLEWVHLWNSTNIINCQQEPIIICFECNKSIVSYQVQSIYDYHTSSFDRSKFRQRNWRSR